MGTAAALFTGAVAGAGAQIGFDYLGTKAQKKANRRALDIIESQQPLTESLISAAGAKGQRTIQRGLTTAQRTLQQAQQAGRQDIRQGLGIGRADIQAGLGRAEGLAQPFIQGGQRSFDLQLAQSGALGADAQAQAFANFSESPGVSFLREQGNQSINQSAAARGGLGGANRLKALSAFNQGLAQQDFSNQFNRLTGLTGLGFTASQNLGSQSIAAGQNLASLSEGASARLANQGLAVGSQLSGQQLQAARDRSGIQIDTGLNLANVGAQGATQRAAIESGQGQLTGNFLQRTGETAGATVEELAAIQSLRSKGLI